MNKFRPKESRFNVLKAGTCRDRQGIGSHKLKKKTDQQREKLRIQAKTYSTWGENLGTRDNKAFTYLHEKPCLSMGKDTELPRYRKRDIHSGKWQSW